MAFSFTEPFGEDPEYDFDRFKQLLPEVLNELKFLINNCKGVIIESENQDRRNKIIDRIEVNTKQVDSEFYSFFKNSPQYLSFIILGRNFNQYLIDFQELLRNVNLKIHIDGATLINVLMSLRELVQTFETLKLIASNESKSKDLISRLELQVEKATQSAQGVESAKLALEANGTDEIYKSLSEKYQNEYELNNEYFRNSLILTGCCTLLSIIYTLNIPVNEINWIAFVSIKILIIAIGITLCTLFLRRSAHAKKLHEKAYQTHVEINAYPIFIKSLKEDDQHEITKELALRYFGNDIDQTQNDKIGDLMQDQLLAGTELIKASAELVKAKQGSGGEG